MLFMEDRIECVGVVREKVCSEFDYWVWLEYRVKKQGVVRDDVGGIKWNYLQKVLFFMLRILFFLLKKGRLGKS